MSKLTMFDRSSSQINADIERAAGKLEMMTYPKGMSFKIEVELDSKIDKAVSKDPLLQQEMTDEIGKVYDDLIARIGENLKNTDKGAITLRDTNKPDKLQKLIEVVNKGITGAVDVAKGAAEKAALKAWTDFTATKKQYSSYKIKVGVKIVGALAGLAVSIALLATGVVSFGASSIPGIVGMVKSVVTVGDEIRKLNQSLDTATKALETNIKIVEDHYLNARKEFTAKGKAAEVGTLVFKQFIGVSLPSIKTCVENLGTAKNKHAGTIVKAHDAAKDLNKALLKIEAFKLEFVEGCRKKLEKHPSPLAKDQPAKIKDQLDEACAPMYMAVQDCISEVTKYVNRAKTFEPKLKIAEAKVGELVKLKGVGFAIFENLLVFSDIALSFTDPAQYAKLSETLGNLIPPLGQFAYDKISKKALEGTFFE